ncbi:hypothetical protein TNIN_370211 [Trichonephila inaurata madagascariensis]|uniref:Uncharacterized protein n=1 Tax=Trichonephila inaurata madagascariensis TaxID=2747483 RepID=A0A8X6M863_9ARAC|nr:hypothetical protein TNIN_370211 [Trichonephila inaurata madagascariensis]
MLESDYYNKPMYSFSNWEHNIKEFQFFSVRYAATFLLCLLDLGELRLKDFRRNIIEANDLSLRPSSLSDMAIIKGKLRMCVCVRPSFGKAINANSITSIPFVEVSFSFLHTRPSP